MSRGAFADQYNVSRETLDCFDRYEALLKKWNKAINLVSNATLGDVWTRHFSDSAQIFEIAKPNRTDTHWIDLGSGAGFPGLVVALLAREATPTLRFSMIESDKRKCIFLSEVARACGLEISVVNSRVEDVDLTAQIVSARALAPLATLLEMSEKLLEPGGKAVFLKGGSVNEELTAANLVWHTELITKHRSRTDARGTVLEIGRFHRRTSK